MLETNGTNFNATLDTIKPKLSPSERKKAAQNTIQIMEEVVKAYEKSIGPGHVGKDGNGIPAGFSSNRQKPSGLVYGRIQSGKTRAMVTSTALAFDNGFKAVVVLTSNINLLVGQTQDDFTDGLPKSVRVYSKYDFQDETKQAKRVLKSSKGGIVIVCAKGDKRLKQAIEFLSEIGAQNVPTLIFDDEGDQASLDTNIGKRAKKNLDIPPSTISRLIYDRKQEVDSLRRVMQNHVFISVTGTPQALVLQNADSEHRPSFIKLLEPGTDYIGGEHFFLEENPLKNKLIFLIARDEKTDLLDGDAENIPDGLREAIRFFLLAASAAGKELGWPKGGYKFLCHPSVKIAHHKKVADSIRAYLGIISESLENSGSAQCKDLVKNLKKTYSDLKKCNPKIVSFQELLDSIIENIDTSKVFVINTTGTKREALSYGGTFNFLVGGNTLGRGLAIKKLLVTYYVRESARTQMDTMYQHARMFGYRKDTLPFTKVFLPPQLFVRFREMYLSDEELRDFISGCKKPGTFPVRISSTIRATRSGILDGTNIDYLIPGKQFYPNYPYFGSPQLKTIRDEILKKLRKIFPNLDLLKGEHRGKEISTEEAIKLISIVRTSATNKWKDKNIPAILSDLKTRLGDGVTIKFRRAERTSGNCDGLLAQGVLAGDDVARAAAEEKPVLWLFDTSFTAKNVTGWDGSRFIYPTIVLPQNTELVVFNKS